MADDLAVIKAAFREYQEDNRPAGYAAAFAAGWHNGRDWQREQGAADRAIASAARAYFNAYEANESDDYRDHLDEANARLALFTLIDGAKEGGGQ